MNLPSTSKTIGKLAGSVPSLVINVLMVAIFLGYLVKMNERDDLVARQRIQECHDHQQRSVDVLEDVAIALKAQAIEFARLRDTVERR